MSRGTIHRTVRIDDGPRQAAKEVARGNDDSLSDIMRQSVERYAVYGSDPLTEILELSQNATTMHSRLMLRDQIQEIAARLRSHNDQ